MRYFGGAGPETPAMTLHTDLEERQRLLDDRHDGLARFAIAEPDVFVGQLEGGHTLVAVDESVQPGGAFKYFSSAASVTALPETITEAVTATAGNFGKTLGEATLRAGLKSRAFAPFDLNDVKARGMADTGTEVVLAADDVSGAMAFAKDYVARTPGAALLHPYDNPWGIAGLRYMGGHVSNALRKLEADGRIDLGQPVDVLIPLGGGSGLAGAASKLYSDKQDGSLPDTLSVHAVRPRRLRGGELDPRFDGLRVDTPGSNTSPFLEDQRFVAGTRLVGQAAVADGTRLMAGLNDVAYEPNALVTAGAVSQWIADHPGAAPRTFVAVLTGRNSDRQQYDYFSQLPGYRSTEGYAARHAAAERRQTAALAQLAFQREVTVTRDIAPHGDPRRAAGSVCLAGATLRGYVKL